MCPLVSLSYNGIIFFILANIEFVDNNIFMIILLVTSC